MTVWYADFQFWCVVVVLAVCLWHLSQAPAWWRGDWRASRIRWRNRAWLPAMVALTAACLLTIMMFVVGEADLPIALTWLGRLLFVIGGLSLLAIPLLGWVPAFDFAVPPPDRTNVPPPPLNRAARRAQARRSPPLKAPVPGRTAIRFHRPAVRFKDRFRAYRLEIDGEPVGEIRHGGEVVRVDDR